MRNILAGKGKQRGPVMLDCVCPALGGFGGVGRAHHVEVRDGAQTCQLFDRFVSGTIFAHSHAVVSEDVEHFEIAECTQANGRFHVIGEDKKSSRKRQQSAMGRHAVDCCAHSVFANSEGNVVARITPDAAHCTGAGRTAHLWRLKIALAF